MKQRLEYPDHLPINVVDRGRGEQKTADYPAIRTGTVHGLGNHIWGRRMRGIAVIRPDALIHPEPPFGRES